MNYSDCTHLNEPPKPEGFIDRYVDYLCGQFGLWTAGKLLDVGCGNGEYVDAFKRAGKDAKGIDKYSYYDINGDIELMTTNRYGFYDVVHSKSVIEHCRYPMNAIENMWHLCEPGGICIILTPDIEYSKWSFYGDIGHVSPFNRNKLYQLFAYADFKDISVERFTHWPHGWKKPLKGMLIGKGKK